MKDKEIKELIALCREALEGLYTEHAENCHMEDCSYMETYYKLIKATK